MVRMFAGLALAIAAVNALPQAGTSTSAAPAAASSGTCESLAGGEGPSQYTDANGSVYNITCKHDIAGGNMRAVSSPNFQGCFSECDQRSACVGFSFLNGVCYLKSSQASGLSTSPADVAQVVSKASPGVTVTAGGTTATGSVPTAPTASAACTSLPKQVGLYTNTCGADRLGGDLYSVSATSFLGCESPCDAEPECVGYTYVGGSGPGTCYLKSSLSPQTDNPGVDVAVKPQAVSSSILSSALPTSVGTSGSPGIPTSAPGVSTSLSGVPTSAPSLSVPTSVPSSGLPTSLSSSGVPGAPTSASSSSAATSLSSSAGSTSAPAPSNSLLTSVPSGFTAIPTSALPSGFSSSYQSFTFATGVVPSSLTVVPNSIASQLATQVTSSTASSSSSAPGTTSPSSTSAAAGGLTSIPSGFTAIPTGALPSGFSSSYQSFSFATGVVPSSLTVVPNSLASQLATRVTSSAASSSSSSAPATTSAASTSAASTSTAAAGGLTSIPSGFTAIPTGSLPTSLGSAVPSFSFASGVVPSSLTVVPNSIASQIATATRQASSTGSASSGAASSSASSAAPTSAGGLQSIPSGFTAIPTGSLPSSFGSSLPKFTFASGVVPSSLTVVPDSVASQLASATRQASSTGSASSSLVSTTASSAAPTSAGGLTSIPSGFTAIPTGALPSGFGSLFPKFTFASGVVPSSLTVVPDTIASQLGSATRAPSVSVTAPTVSGSGSASMSASMSVSGSGSVSAPSAPSTFSTSLKTSVPTSAPSLSIPSTSVSPSMAATIVTHTIVSQISTGGSVSLSTSFSTSLAIPTTPLNPPTLTLTSAKSTFTNFVTVPVVSGTVVSSAILSQSSSIPTGLPAVTVTMTQMVPASMLTSATKGFGTATLSSVITTLNPTTTRLINRSVPTNTPKATTTPAAPIPSTGVIGGIPLPYGDKCKSLVGSQMPFQMIVSVIGGNRGFEGWYFANPFGFGTATASLTPDVRNAARFYYDRDRQTIGALSNPQAAAIEDCFLYGISLLQPWINWWDPNNFGHFRRDEADEQDDEAVDADEGVEDAEHHRRGRMGAVAFTPGFASRHASDVEGHPAELRYGTHEWGAWIVCGDGQLKFVGGRASRALQGMDPSCARIKLQRVNF